MTRIRTVAALVVAGALALPAAAAAHVTVQPQTAPAGGEVRLDVRVPNERDDADTTKLQLELPPGFAQAAWQPIPGWSVRVGKTKLARPIKTDDGEVTEEVSTLTWTGHGAQGRIPPGAFQDFGLSVLLPDHAGSTLTFKALQTYSDGKVVRWIGPEGTDAPAPTVKLTAASASATAAPAKRPAPASGASGGGGSDTLAIVAIVVGALGLAAGAAGLAAARRARTAPERPVGERV